MNLAAPKRFQEWLKSLEVIEFQVRDALARPGTQPAPPETKGALKSLKLLKTQHNVALSWRRRFISVPGHHMLVCPTRTHG